MRSGAHASAAVSAAPPSAATRREVRDRLLVSVRGARVAAAHEQKFQQRPLATRRGEVRGVGARCRARARASAPAPRSASATAILRASLASPAAAAWQGREPVARPGQVRVHPGAQKRARDVGAPGRARLDQRRELATKGRADFRLRGDSFRLRDSFRSPFGSAPSGSPVVPSPYLKYSAPRNDAVLRERRSPQDLRRGERPVDGSRVERARAVLLLAERRGGFALAQTRTVEPRGGVPSTTNGVVFTQRVFY